MIKIKNLNRFVNGKPEVKIIETLTPDQEMQAKPINGDPFYLRELAHTYKKQTGRYLFKDSRKR